MTAAFRVLFTGSREVPRDDMPFVVSVLEGSRLKAPVGSRLIVVHGAGRGADSLAHRWADATPGVESEPHPADWERYGRKAGPIRNAEMVALGADLCIAVPGLQSRGTWDCVRRARAAGILTLVFPLYEPALVRAR